MRSQRSRASWSLVLVGVLACGTAEPGGSPATSSAPAVALSAPPQWATPAADAGRLPDEAVAHLTVLLARPAERQRAFDLLRAAQETPTSPAYHQWLTPSEIGERFGASDGDLAAVTSWLEAQGLAVLHVGNARTFIEVGGTTRTVEAAFGVELHRYRVGARVLRAPDRAPSIPAALARTIVGVTGLTERTAAPQHVVGPAVQPDGVNKTGAHFIGVGDFATIYDLAPAYADQLDGSGQVIGIIGRSRVFAPDITNFGARQNATLAAFTTIIPPGTGVDPGSACGSAGCAGSSSVDDQFEATLDVTRVTSIATGAKVELIASATDQSGDDGILIATLFAIDAFGSAADANILSLSFGACETAEGGSAVVGEIDAFYQQAAAQGQTLFVSAGDAGAAGCDVAFQTPPASQTLGVNGLCTSSASTCVGGTEFADFTDPATFWGSNGSALSYIPEGVWNEPLSGAGAPVAQGGGGGISQVIALPAYQTGLGPTGNTFRLVPDVSLSSSCHDFYFICMAAFDAGCTLGSGSAFSFEGACGTSAAAPSLAAMMAMVFSKTGGHQGAANPGFYALAAQPANQVFHDVNVTTSGVGSACAVATPSMCNNSDPSSTGLTGGQPGFLAADGFDEATGWGSIDVGVLGKVWNNAVTSTLTLDPTSATVAAGETAMTDVTTTGLVAPTFACSGLPADAACQFGSGSATTLAITTTGPHAASAGVTGGPDPRALFLLVAGLALALAALLRRPRWRVRAAALGLVVAASAVSCGKSTPQQAVDGAMAIDAPSDALQTPTGTFTVTVTATSGAATASATFSLTVTD